MASRPVRCQGGRNRLLVLVSCFVKPGGLCGTLNLAPHADHLQTCQNKVVRRRIHACSPCTCEPRYLLLLPVSLFCLPISFSFVSASFLASSESIPHSAALLFVLFHEQMELHLSVIPNDPSISQLKVYGDLPKLHVRLSQASVIFTPGGAHRCSAQCSKSQDP